jgi:hypothetical protein
VWILLQVLFNIFVLAGIIVCLIKAFKSKEDDPRLTQGLRLLQSKISILEDLSDHTENQVKQLMTLLDKKLHEVREVMGQVNQHMGEVDRSIKQSQRVAQQIQNEMTPDRIFEKKLENKYIQAARLAHSGYSVEEIVQQLQLPKAEVELIAKVNKKKCVYEGESGAVQDKIFAKSLQMPRIEGESLNQTHMAFQQAVQDHKEQSEFRALKLG